MAKLCPFVGQDQLMSCQCVSCHLDNGIGHGVPSPSLLSSFSFFFLSFFHICLSWPLPAFFSRLSPSGGRDEWVGEVMKPKGIWSRCLPLPLVNEYTGNQESVSRVHPRAYPRTVSFFSTALRSRSGRSIINGNWAIDRPGKYEGGGTMFTYKRPNEISSTAGESFLAEGPTNEILDVYVSWNCCPDFMSSCF